VLGEVMVMAEIEKKARNIWRGEISCAFCGKRNTVRVEKETIETSGSG